MEKIKEEILFGLGDTNDANAEHFINQSYLKMLVNEADIDVVVANVTFEPGCRNDWHIHENGGYQILLVTNGEGYCQEENQDIRLLSKGDVVLIKSGIKHWHGARQDSWFTHVAITKGNTAWLEKVDDEYYNNLAK